MPIIEPKNQKVKKLEGVHLFHAPFSNCSQRARMVLEEKHIPWESHQIELMEFEHLTEEYQSLHPKGVVPALVHNGTVVVESNDIIQYLDDHFEGKSLMPQTEEDKASVRPWMQLSADLQPAMKTLTYDRILGKKYPPTPEKFEYYKKHQRNPELIKFWQQFLEGFDQDLLEKCEKQTKEFLARINEGLEGKIYLIGKKISLADFSAVVNVHRSNVLGISLNDFTNTVRWYNTMRQRPSFKNAILAYVPD